MTLSGNLMVFSWVRLRRLVTSVLRWRALVSTALVICLTLLLVMILLVRVLVHLLTVATGACSLRSIDSRKLCRCDLSAVRSLLSRPSVIVRLVTLVGFLGLRCRPWLLIRSWWVVPISACSGWAIWCVSNVLVTVVRILLTMTVTLTWFYSLCRLKLDIDAGRTNNKLALSVTRCFLITNARVLNEQSAAIWFMSYRGSILAPVRFRGPLLLGATSVRSIRLSCKASTRCRRTLLASGFAARADVVVVLVSRDNRWCRLCNLVLCSNGRVASLATSMVSRVISAAINIACSANDVWCMETVVVGRVIVLPGVLSGTRVGSVCPGVAVYFVNCLDDASAV